MSSSSTLSPEQLNRVLSNTPKKQTTSAIEYDPKYDAELVGMFGRRWDELETFDPFVKGIFHTLNFTVLLWENPTFASIPLLMAVARTTRDETIRYKAFVCLRKYLMDCSGTDSSLKSDVVKLLADLDCDTPLPTPGSIELLYNSPPSSS